MKYEKIFRISVGELLDNRYKSYAFTGKGVFSNVIRCKGNLLSRVLFNVLVVFWKVAKSFKNILDKHENDKDVAIKIIRKNELMHKAGKFFYLTMYSESRIKILTIFV